jgi:hypothetical protein
VLAWRRGTKNHFLIKPRRSGDKFPKRRRWLRSNNIDVRGFAILLKHTDQESARLLLLHLDAMIARATDSGQRR